MEKKGKDPIIMAGHSLGEYSALVCSQSIKLSDALKLVIFRKILMEKRNKINPSAMKIIIGLNKETIIQIIKNFQLKKRVDIACINSENQIVIAGYKEDVCKVASYCKQIGANKIIKLPSDIISHCNMMKKSSIKLKKMLNKIHIQAPICKIVNNVDVKCEYSKKNICNALTKQLYQTVRWKESLEYMQSKNIKLFLEIGNGTILTNLNKKLINLTSIPLNNLKNIKKALKKTNEK
ncbi:ACP S-malonyltransferase [Buchnera aphidicola (Hormaphis cornu)]|nr:ACP S-malonyltransferase [Buchnera aphidicola (Hormaphis cornu)]